MREEAWPLHRRGPLGRRRNSCRRVCEGRVSMHLKPNRHRPWRDGLSQPITAKHTDSSSSGRDVGAMPHLASSKPIHGDASPPCRSDALHAQCVASRDRYQVIQLPPCPPMNWPVQFPLGTSPTSLQCQVRPRWKASVKRQCCAATLPTPGVEGWVGQQNNVGLLLIFLSSVARTESPNPVLLARLHSRSLPRRRSS